MPELKRRQREFLDCVIAALDDAGAKPPPPRELARSLSVPVQAVEGILGAGVEQGEIVRLENGFHFAIVTLRRLAEEGLERFGSDWFDVGAFRDYLDVSRETAFALLSQLEAMGLVEADAGRRRFLPTE